MKRDLDINMVDGVPWGFICGRITARKPDVACRKTNQRPQTDRHITADFDLSFESFGQGVGCDGGSKSTCKWRIQNRCDQHDADEEHEHPCKKGSFQVQREHGRRP
ncbi:hypothetical protein LAX5112_05017 [Roseibium alexandrii]|uniref:Uncharacterized protein n=1 Tax=Roseibium alexandrii TaxID=388408 RepID=A0A0M7ARC3_9HYPH|nr:hypothetical protein LAX5112_05017 [Roseibium alexandrii]